MQEVTLTRYKCGICGKQYDAAKDAIGCEAVPVSMDKGEWRDVPLEEE